mmetsp:Transcript_56779/g.134029  ORF Transcript_56779/g.134029 Transcript_56779/m.134029 type:complete len:125 (-) Transcript_56779:74-448(-)
MRASLADQMGQQQHPQPPAASQMPPARFFGAQLDDGPQQPGEEGQPTAQPPAQQAQDLPAPGGVLQAQGRDAPAVLQPAFEDVAAQGPPAPLTPPGGVERNFCNLCGARLAPEAAFCGGCGGKI